MQLGDIDAVMVIDRLAFSTPWKASGYRYELTENERAHYKVLTVNTAAESARLIGYVGHWLLAGEAHISTIALHPDWRGRSLGELLLLSALLQAHEQSAEMATLEVRRSNSVAQALYRKYQFQVTGERRRYYHDNQEDALLMTVEALDDAYHNFLQQQGSRLSLRLAKLRVSSRSRVK